MFWKSMNKYGFTQNDALTYKTSGSAVLDFFAMGGAMRFRSEGEIISMFEDAFKEDPILATKVLFYLRDCRGGMGEKKVFRVASKWLVDTYKDFPFKTFTELVEKYGSWKDIFSTFNVNTYKDAVAMNFALNLEKGIPTLMEKYMPSIGGSKNKDAESLAKYIQITPREYRKLLSLSRSRLNLVETKMSSGKWSEIGYSSVPSRAMMLYSNAFARNDQDRYEEYMLNVKDGKEKINVGGLFPYEIFRGLKNNSLTNDNATIMWDNLPDYTDGKNAIVMADTSWSMTWNDGIPMAVSVSLALYFAERNKGAFNGSFMTFSANPSIVNIKKGKTLKERLNDISRADWGGNTNLIKAFELILEVAKRERIPENEMPGTIYVISDMEFDEANGKGYGSEGLLGKTNHEVIKEKYQKAGYKIPRVVYWNVDSKQDNVPVEKNELGVALISGFSPTAFKLAIDENATPMSFMLDTINTERYKDVEKLFK